MIARMHYGNEHDILLERGQASEPELEVAKNLGRTVLTWTNSFADMTDTTWFKKILREAELEWSYELPHRDQIIVYNPPRPRDEKIKVMAQNLMHLANQICSNNDGFEFIDHTVDVRGLIIATASG